MAGPFVISMKFEADGSGVRSTTGAIRQDLGGVREVLNAAGAGAANLNEKAAGAAMSLQRLADQQQRMQAISATGIDKSFGIGGGADSSTRAADIAAYGDELDRLRARFNPLYAAIKQYRHEVGQIREAHRVGAISTDEMSAALGRERTATLASISALKQRQQAMAGGGGSSFSTSNIAAQFQDIGVTAAMGMSPLQIALQQGTQLSAVFEQLKASGQGVGSALRTAFLSVISPMSLITIGAVAVAAAAAQWLLPLIPRVESASEAIERHSGVLKSAVAGYEQATKVVDEFAGSAERLPLGAVEIQLGATLEEMNKKVSDFRREAATMGPTLQGSLNAGDRAMGDILVKFTQGQSSAADLVTELTRIEHADWGPFGFTVAGVAARLREAATAAEKFAGAYVYIQHALAGAAENGGVKMALEASIASERSAQSHQIELDAIKAKTPEQLADIARRRTALQLVDQEITESLRQQKIDEAGSLAFAQGAAREAEASAKKQSAFDQASKSVRERLEQMQLETSLIGQSTFASERARIVLELENAAREDAIGLTTGRAAAIQQEADAYAFAAIAREQMTEREREGREEFEFYQGTFRSFFTSFFSDIARGENAWDSFANAASGALDRVADRALGMAADGIFDLIFGAITGGLTGGLGGGGNGFIPTLTGPSLGSFDTGGWTGGNRGQVRGFVHGEEFVVKAGPAAANRAMLEQLNAGGTIGGIQLTYAPSYVVQGNADERVMERAARQAKEEFWAEFPVRYADAVRRGKVG